MPGRFSGIATRKNPAGAEQEVETLTPAKSVGRPKKSKTGDPNYRTTTVRAHIDTFADAEANLRKIRSDKDMSDLVNALLREWNQNPKN